MIPNLALALTANAEGPVLAAVLTLVGGEDPSIPNTFSAEGNACLVPPLVKVSIVGIDPARFPAGPASSAEVRVGAIRAKGRTLAVLPVTDPENTFGVDVTMLDFAQKGPVAAGDIVQVRIRSDFVVAGWHERHQTLWAGTLTAVERTPTLSHVKVVQWTDLS